MNKFKKSYPRTYKTLKYGGQALQVANKAYSMARTVASIVNSEKKYFDVVVGPLGTDTTASITCLSNMAQGDTNITRDGNTVALKSLQIEGYINHDISTPFDTTRVILFRDNDNDAGTAPTITELLESSSVMALRNKNTARKYTVLMDKIFTVDLERPARMWKYYKKFTMMKDRRGNPTKSHHLYFDGTAAADYTRGHLFLLVLGTTATASSSTAFGFNSRIRFYDN